MEKILQLLEMPIIGRLHITYPLYSVMQHKDGNNFLYTYFVNLECSKDLNNDLNYCFVSQGVIANPNCLIFELLACH